MFNLFFHVLVFLLVVLDMIPYTFFSSPTGFPEGSSNSYAAETEKEKTNPSPNAEHLRYGKISFGFRTVFGKTP
jgi:hypothetical protein